MWRTSIWDRCRRPRLSLPTLYEGFGLPIIEAPFCGAPVLTSAATATQEVAGDVALLVDPNSRGHCERHCQRLASDAELRAALQRAGEDRARIYSWTTQRRATRRCFAISARRSDQAALRLSSLGLRRAICSFSFDSSSSLSSSTAMMLLRARPTARMSSSSFR